MTTSKIEYIELLRFLAAACVVCVHLPPISAGAFGVDLFFIISGFVMMYSTNFSVKNFFLKRVIRIIPLYWIFTIGVFAIAIIYPELLNNTKANFSELIKSLLFIPFNKNGTGHFPILFLGWTLNYEIYFYLIFGVCSIFFYKVRDLVCSLFLILIVIIFNSNQSFILGVYSNPIVVEFIFGMIAYRTLWLKKYDIHSLLLIFLCVITLSMFPQSRAITLGLPMLVIFYIFHFFFSGKKMLNSIYYLGGCSYSLYLTHPYIIQSVDNFTNLFNNNLTLDIFLIFVSFSLCISFALFVFIFFESKLNKKLRSFLSKK
jgi:exopolysaccharide production protein ExoZ